jgi:uncharacterized protein
VPIYVTPGVYFETVDAPPVVHALRTDIAAFVGIAERGPLDTPTRVESWEQFVSVFGGLQPYAFLAYSVKALFENGGRTCFVVRVADERAAPASIVVRDGVAPALLVEAASPGAWANGLEVRLIRSSPVATRTNGVQPRDGAASRVESVTGFARGALVRAFQAGVTAAAPFRVVVAVDPAESVVQWDEPLDEAFALDDPLSYETVEFALRVFVRSRLVEDFPQLPLVPLQRPRSGPVATGRFVTVLPHPDASPRRDSIAAFHEPQTSALAFVSPRTPAVLTGGIDGLSGLRRDHFTGDRGSEERRGLRALEPVDEVSLVAVPDILVRPVPPVETSPLPPADIDPCLPCAVPPAPASLAATPLEQPPVFSRSDIAAVQNALVLHCEEQRDRIALLDPPGPDVDVGQIQAWRARFDSKYAALYHPWVLVFDPLTAGRVRAVPPSGHVAGVCARTDLTIGVHNAPANDIVEWAVGLTSEIGPELQGILNPIGVNCIRPLMGRGIRVYGARTVSSDRSWRFLNVRRLFCMIEEAVEEAVQWTVFEPNDFGLRQSLTISISSFLEQLWERGAFAGATPATSFYVKCDEDNNPQEEASAGKLIVEVGVAAVRPAEFVVFRIGRTRDELEVIE